MCSVFSVYNIRLQHDKNVSVYSGYTWTFTSGYREKWSLLIGWTCHMLYKLVFTRVAVCSLVTLIYNFTLYLHIYMLIYRGYINLSVLLAWSSPAPNNHTICGLCFLHNDLYYIYLHWYRYYSQLGHYKACVFWAIDFIPSTCIFTGVTLNWGVLLSWSAIHGTVQPAVIPLYMACVFYTMIYDSIYSHQVPIMSFHCMQLHRRVFTRTLSVQKILYLLKSPLPLRKPYLYIS